jgi:transposase
MFFGGIVATLIPDNTKAMINDPDALTPTLVASFLDYVQARGIFVDPARVRSPQDKPRVENQVSFVRESWFDGETFTSLEHARESAEHSTTYRSTSRRPRSTRTITSKWRRRSTPCRMPTCASTCACAPIARW